MQDEDVNSATPTTQGLDIAGLPAPLPADTRRQAVSSISGTVYQAWCSIEAWVQLEDAHQVIYLEGAEDFDVHRLGSAVTVQVRRTAAHISLGSEKARKALENFWSQTVRSPAIVVECHYLTTSAVAFEQGEDFDGLAGIPAWTAAQTSLQLTAKLATYLKATLPDDSPLRGFLISADASQVQQKLIRRFRWLTHQPDINAVKQSVTERVGELLRHRRRAASMATTVCKWLESHFWEVVVRPDTAERHLTLTDLFRLVDEAANPLAAFATAQLPNLLDAASPAQNLLKLLARPAPAAPAPLLMRHALSDRLSELVRQRKSALVTGTVSKGKTTLVQVVLEDLATSSLWVDLAAAEAAWEKLLFSALSTQMDDASLPTVIVLDDLNLSPGRQQVYGTALVNLLRRAEASGRSIILTAQGESTASLAQQRLPGITAVEVPEIGVEEAKALCVDHGCPAEWAGLWSVFVTAKTGGHPKLVQIMLDELSQRRWPMPQTNEMGSPSPGLASARQATRQLLSDTVTAPEAELLYHASLCIILIHRSVLIRLIELVSDTRNAGDVIDRYAGKWIECIEGEWYRTTALLSGSAKQVWSEDQVANAHARLHTALHAKSPLTPPEAAALLYHAYFSGNQRLIAITAINLQRIDSEEARQEVERNLLWLPYLAIGPEQRISDSPYAAVILRGLQFSVATALDDDAIPHICDRWFEEIGLVEVEEIRSTLQAHLWLAVGFAKSDKIPLRRRLEAASGLLELQGEAADIAKAALATTLTRETIEADIPSTASIAQMVLLNVSRFFEGIADLGTLVAWLNSTTEISRDQFEDFLGWPVVQTMGAFVQAAWSRRCDSTDDWSPWIVALDSVAECARSWGLRRFGREAAKAKAIILMEYLSDADVAIACLDQAEVDFGPSGILLEQRANLSFHQHQFESVLQIWQKLSQAGLPDVFFDPFAARRAGISAGHLTRWHEAETIFHIAAIRKESLAMPRINFGLQVDAALAASHGGSQDHAAAILAEGVIALPSEAANEGDPSWESVQRIAVAVCHTIEHHLGDGTVRPQSVELGVASAPGGLLKEATPGQSMRTEMTKVQALRLAGTLGIWPRAADVCLASLEESRYLLVRLAASETRLSLAYSHGAGEGFIASVKHFDQMLKLMLIHRNQGPGYELDEVELAQPSTMGPASFGYLIAGTLCAGKDLVNHLALWQKDAMSHGELNVQLCGAIRRLLDGAQQSGAQAERTAMDTERDGFVRLGAIASWSLECPSASQLFELQQFLIFPLLSDMTRARQALFNHHVAKALAQLWLSFVTSAQFQLVSPRTTVPALTAAIDTAQRGQGTIRSILTTAASAVGSSINEALQALV